MNASAIQSAQYEALHAAANEAALTMRAHTAPTLVPPAPIAAPKPCDRCESAYHAAAPTRGWCAECAPDGVLIGVLCACGCERLLDGQERCETCEEALASETCGVCAKALAGGSRHVSNGDVFCSLTCALHDGKARS